MTKFRQAPNPAHTGHWAKPERRRGEGIGRRTEESNRAGRRGWVGGRGLNWVGRGGTEKLRKVGGGLNRVAMGHQGTAEKAGFLR